jgi:hypothetical protein
MNRGCFGNDLKLVMHLAVNLFDVVCRGIIAFEIHQSLPREARNGIELLFIETE